MKEVFNNEYYRTNKGTIIGIYTDTADISHDPFSPTVYGDSKEEIAKELLIKAYESDGFYIRNALRDIVRNFINVDIELKDNVRVVDFHLNYGDKQSLKSFSLHSSDDITRESLYRVFADELTKDLFENTQDLNINPSNFTEKIFSVPGFHLNDIVPATLAVESNMLSGFCVLPEYLIDINTFTEEGKELFHSSTPSDILYRFQSYTNTYEVYGFCEYSEDGKKLNEQSGFYGSDIERNGMQHVLNTQLKTFLGEYESIEECIQHFKDGPSLDSIIGYNERAANANVSKDRDNGIEEKII